MIADPPFNSLYSHGFVRVAAAVPHVRVANPVSNADPTLGLARHAAESGAALVIFPELGLSSYTNEDLFHQGALSRAVAAALEIVVSGSDELAPLIVVGAPHAALRLRAQQGRVPRVPRLA